MRAGQREQLLERRDGADQVRPSRIAPRGAVEPERAGRGSREGGSRTGSSPRLRSSSARSCGRAGRARSRAAPADLEELDGEHADVAELLEQRGADRLGLAPAARPCGGRTRHGGGCRRGGRSRPAGRTRISPSARRARRRSTARARTATSSSAQLAPRRAARRRVGRDALALAVVAEAPRLHERRERPAARRASPNGAVGMPSAAGRAASRAAGPAPSSSDRGRGERRRTLARAAPTGTFSNS